MLFAYGPFNKSKMVCINFPLTAIQFSHNECTCSIHIRLICSGLNLIFCCVCFYHIQTLYFSMIHAYGPLNMLRMVCMNVPMTIILFSHTRSTCSRHIRLIWSTLTLMVLVVAFRPYLPIVFLNDTCPWTLQQIQDFFINFSLTVIQFSLTRNVSVCG